MQCSISFLAIVLGKHHSSIEPHVCNIVNPIQQVLMGFGPCTCIHSKSRVALCTNDHVTRLRAWQKICGYDSKQRRYAMWYFIYISACIILSYSTKLKDVKYCLENCIVDIQGRFHGKTWMPLLNFPFTWNWKCLWGSHSSI